MAQVKATLRLEDVTYTMLLHPVGAMDKRAHELAVWAIGAQAEADTQILALQRHLEQRNG